ncbi:MAG: hypothetical protein WA876_07500 [Candidatus Acidiferrales bacterium]
MATIVALSLFLKAYWIRNESGGWLLWNTEDVYIFIDVRVDGFRPTYLGFVGQEIKGMFPFGGPTPDEQHLSVLVLHVTRDAVQQDTIDNCWLGGGPEPFHGELYAGNMLPGGKFMKWTGTHFEPATSEEMKKFHEYAINLPKGPPAGPSYDHVEGWSKRTLAGEVIRKSPTDYVEKDNTATIEVDGEPLTFVMNSGFVTRRGYIDLIRPGQPPERIWRWNEDPHFVSRAEYYRLFGDQIAREVVQQISSSQP